MGRLARLVLRRLSASPRYTWGFRIYRTTYSPLSDREFPLALETLHRNIKSAAFKDITAMPRAGFPRPQELLSSQYQPTVLDDCNRFNGLSLSVVREDFESWIETQDEIDDFRTSQHAICLVIDDDVIQAFVDARQRANLQLGSGNGDPDADAEAKKLWRWTVKSVEAWPETDENCDKYDGVMEAPVGLLWDLYKELVDCEPVQYLLRTNGVYGVLT
ncbi:uncharacterized protein BDV14DRAFT_171279 [Aspergillus stella-maris]|uniref:uncharacterized protein n=1 Tax=Aspergillus stella-maris TaxID=1810926 RepID=UPI003CCCEEDB